jgi:hypothetical protein
MEAWRLKMEQWRVWRLIIADFLHFNEIRTKKGKVGSVSGVTELK